MDVEFSLIERIRRRALKTDAVLLGIGDDAALLRGTGDQAVVVCTDTLVAGVHFPPETAPADIGWKALAVNLSDLAAMGARPTACTLALTLPEADAAWIEAFLDGFCALAGAHGVALIGGDTTRGPLCITVTALGTVAAQQALRRDGAQHGDVICVTGTLGDAAAAVRHWQAGEPTDAALRQRLDRPEPRVAAGQALRGVAKACIDISDGLLADLGHVLAASGVGAELTLPALPSSSALRERVHERERWPLQLAGGDDYELCFCVPAVQLESARAQLAALGVACTAIGQIIEGCGIVCRDHEGREYSVTRTGYRHFSESVPQ